MYGLKRYTIHFLRFRPLQNGTKNYALAVLVLLFVGVNASGQEDHYWNQHIGAKSALVGGAVTASVRDNSAIYYNPGALGFLDRSNFSVTASMYNYRNSFIENGAGKHLNLFNETVEVVPQFISGVIKIPKLEKYTFTFAAFNTVNNNTRFAYRNKMSYELYQQYEGPEKYLGKFEYNSKIREDWTGIGVAFKSWEKASFGISSFVVIRTLNTSHSTAANVFDTNNHLHQIASATYQRDVYVFMVSNLIKLGYNYENEWFRLGVTATTPGIPLPLFSSARLGWKHEINEFDYEENTSFTDIYEEKLKPHYKYPLNIDFGGQFVFFNSTISLRYSWYAPLGDYQLVSFTDKADYLSNSSLPIKAHNAAVWYNGRTIGNIGIGLEKAYNDKLNLIVGFNTNKNAVDKYKLIEEDRWVPTISYWNLYNLSVGMEWQTRQQDNLVLGFSVAFNQRKNDLQVVNLSDPVVANGLLGYPTHTANTQILNIGFVFGYTFNFKTKVERDLLDETRKKFQ